MADVERLVTSADSNPAGKAFLTHLYEGGGLLSAGKPREAKAALERALDLEPKNQKAQNLLGLACFKLGIFDRAAEIYQDLVNDNATDPTLRMNLGLVCLKLNQVLRAIKEFETAVELAPDLKKAQNYLGLARAQMGDYVRARECFLAAGSMTMVEKMEKVLQERSKPSAPAANTSMPISENLLTIGKFRRQGANGTNGHDVHEVSRIGRAEEIDVEIDEEPTVPEAATAETAPEAVAEQPRNVEKDRSGSAWRRVPSTVEVEPLLVEMTKAQAVAQPTKTFEIGSDLISIRVQGEIYTRLEGLMALCGNLQYVSEMKRFRGQATDKTFGEGSRRMVRVVGEGHLYLSIKDRSCTTIELENEPSYFLEDAVVAFEQSIVFENGRVPSKVAPDLHLLHLQGKGRLLVSHFGPLRSIEVKAGSPCSVPLRALLGWHGSLTPKIMVLPGVAEPTPVAELTGDGYAMVIGS